MNITGSAVLAAMLCLFACLPASASVNTFGVGVEIDDDDIARLHLLAEKDTPNGRRPHFAAPGNYRHPAFRNAPQLESERGRRELRARLDVQYASHRFQTFQDGRDVTRDLYLRSYNGQLIGPTLVARPGDTLKIRMSNYLPPDAAHHCHDGTSCDHTVPHSFNTTNLHTHGLHVDPTGISDNVFIRINGGESMDYEIHIPEDHPAGTFWYHAHLHGATAVQVGSGVHGALIVRGDYDRVPAIKAAEERIMVLQAIAYDADGLIESNANFFTDKWHAEAADRGWHYSVNGQVMPEIRMRPGAVELWRFIHGGVRETVNLRLISACDSSYDVPLVQVAADGIAFRKTRLAVDGGTFLAPAYRSDVLVRPLAPGVYYLIDDSVMNGRLPEHYCDQKRGGAAFALDAAAQDIIARVTVEGAYKHMRMPSNAQLAQLIRPRGIEDDELVSEVQFAEFSIAPKDGVDPSDPLQFVGENFHFRINGRSFDPDRPRILKRGQAQTWYLSSLFADHPFHIHVNPFEVIQRDDTGRIVDRYWRDTVLVRQPLPDDDPQAGMVEIRTRYDRYAGAFVLHCHILDHEDRGMMEKVVIEP